MISKISYNNDLYVVGEPIALGDAVDGIIYVPLDDVAEWKELNQGKNIEGYNYNVKKVTQDIFLPTVTTIVSNDYDILNIFDGQYCSEITFSKKMVTHQLNYARYMNFLCFPFDSSVGEIKSKFGEHTINIYSPSDFKVLKLNINENGEFGGNITYSLPISDSDGLAEDTIIKAGTPFILVIDRNSPSYSLLQFDLVFKNKKIVLNQHAEKKIGTDNFYMIGELCKERIHNVTGKSTASNYIIIGAQGVTKGIQTVTVNYGGAFIEYRGEIPLNLS